MWIFLQKGKQIIKYTNQTVYLHSVENNTIQRKIVLSGSFMYPAFSFTELILPLHTDCVYTIQKEACSYNVILVFINPERVFPCLLTAMINYDKTYLIKKKCCNRINFHKIFSISGNRNKEQWFWEPTYLS